MRASSAQNATQLLYLHACYTTVVRSLYDIDVGARPNLVAWYLMGYVMEKYL